MKKKKRDKRSGNIAIGIFSFVALSSISAAVALPLIFMARNSENHNPEGLIPINGNGDGQSNNDGLIPINGNGDGQSNNDGSMTTNGNSGGQTDNGSDEENINWLSSYSPKSFSYTTNIAHDSVLNKDYNEIDTNYFIVKDYSRMEKSKLVEFIKRIFNETPLGPEIIRLKSLEIHNRHWGEFGEFEKNVSGAVGQMFLKQGTIYLYNNRSVDDLQMDYLLEIFIHEYGHMTNAWYFAEGNKQKLYRDWDYILRNNDGVSVPPRIHGEGFILATTFKPQTIKEYYKAMGKEYINLIKEYLDPNVSYDDIHLNPLTRWISQYPANITELLTRTWTNITMRLTKNWEYEYINNEQKFKDKYGYDRSPSIFESTRGGTDQDIFETNYDDNILQYAPRLDGIFRSLERNRKHEFKRKWDDAGLLFINNDPATDDDSPITKTARNVLEFYKRNYRYYNSYSNSYIYKGNLHVDLWLTDEEADKYNGLIFKNGNETILAPFNTIGQFGNITKGYSTLKDLDAYEKWDKKQYEAVIPYSGHKNYILNFFEDKNDNNKIGDGELTNLINPYIGEYHQSIDDVYNVDSHIISKNINGELNLKI